MKKLVWLMLLCLCLCSAAAHAAFDPKAMAIDSLTEVYGYTLEEAEAFRFVDDNAGTLIFYPAEHPTYAYFMTYNANGFIGLESPFHVNFSGYPGEGAIRDFLRNAQANQWFTHWTAEARTATQAMLNDCCITPARQLALALMQDDVPAGQLIQGFFSSCFGDEMNWPEAVTEWRNDLLAQNGAEPFPLSLTPAEGIYSYVLPHGIRYSETTVCEFKGAVPDVLQAVFQAEPHLEGWTCLTGAMFTTENVSNYGPYTGYALAAFEKDSQRLLVALDLINGQWSVYPIGTNALYQDPSLELSITGSEQDITCLIRYDSDNGVQTFRVSLTNPTTETYGHCMLVLIRSYSAVSASGQDRLSIDLDSSSYDCWDFVEQHGDTRTSTKVSVKYPIFLGLRDIEDFPITAAQAQAMASPLPEGYVMANSVHLRKDHSSHSADLGTLQGGTLLPVLGTVPGDPYDWIQTELGLLKGYVCQMYTSLTDSPTGTITNEYPLAIAQARNHLQLKNGTGLFAGTVQELAAGTQMRIIMENGSWFYVVVPREGHKDPWLMDTEGTYGFVKKTDVETGALAIQLDWKN